MTPSNVSRRFFLCSTLGATVLGPARVLAAGKSASIAPSSRFPNVLVSNQEGKLVRFYDDVVKGRVLLFNTMYTVCSSICPPNTANLVAVQELLGNRLGNEIGMVSLTLQPELDTPQTLKEYAQRHDAKWTFLTGRREDMDLVRRSLGFFSDDPAVDGDLSQHAGMLRVGSDALNRWNMIPALAKPQLIIRALERFA